MTMAEAAAIPPVERLSVRRTLRVSLSVFGRNLLPFLIITAIVSLPYVLAQTWLDILVARGDAAASTLPVRLLVAGAQAIAFGLLQAVLTHGTIQDLRGRRPTIADSFRGGFARPGTVLFGAVVYGVMLGVATMLFVIPGILVFLSFWVFMPVMVVEKRSTSASFARSGVLIAGRRWTILALAAVVLAGMLLLAVVLGGTSALILGTDESLMVDIVLTLVAVLHSTGQSVVAAVGYYHLRVEKEGIIIEDIAPVFD